MVANTLSHQDLFLVLLNQASKLGGRSEDPRIVILAANYAWHSHRAVEREDLVRAKKEARYMAAYRPEPWKEFTDIVCHGKQIPTYEPSGEA